MCVIKRCCLFLKAALDLHWDGYSWLWCQFVVEAVGGDKYLCMKFSGIELYGAEVKVFLDSSAYPLSLARSLALMLLVSFCYWSCKNIFYAWCWYAQEKKQPQTSTINKLTNCNIYFSPVLESCHSGKTFAGLQALDQPCHPLEPHRCAWVDLL